MIRRMPWIRFTCLLVLVSGCDVETSRSPQRPVDIVIVTLDTTRADRLGAYGYPKPTSPNFDALAAESVLFERAIAQAANTPVSHASIFTGLNPYRHGVRVIFARGGYRLKPGVPYLPELLRGAGYDTAAFLSSFTTSRFYGLDRGFERFDDVMPSGRAFERVPPARPDGRWDWAVGVHQRRADETTELALRWLEGAGEPFLLWVHYWDPHDMHVLPPPESLDPWLSPGADLGEQRNAVYDAEVRYVDAQLGRLMDSLRTSGKLDRTVLVVVADHGEGLGDHGWKAHRLLYQEQIHVPLLVRWPGGPRGVRVEALVRTIDIVPTLLELVGVAPPTTPIDGRSLVGLARGEREPERIAYADQLNLYDLNAGTARVRPRDDLLFVAMDARWKLIEHPNHPGHHELYDLELDPRELENVHASDAEAARRLRAHLEAAGGYVDAPFGGPESPSSPEVIEALEALGYVE